MEGSFSLKRCFSLITHTIIGQRGLKSKLFLRYRGKQRRHRQGHWPAEQGETPLGVRAGMGTPLVLRGVGALRVVRCGSLAAEQAERVRRSVSDPAGRSKRSESGGASLTPQVGASPAERL